MKHIKFGYQLLAILLIALPALAADQALLIGVGAYPGLGPAQQLDGPRHDVAALRRVLIQQGGFASERVHTLVDAQATRAAVLQRLDDLVRTAAAGDRVLIYFSGHGTSAGDAKFSDIKLAPHTGALAAYDFAFGTTQQTRERLIIGTRDLKPRLLALDATCRVVFICDACYSGYTMRALAMPGAHLLKRRFIDTRQGRYRGQPPPLTEEAFNAGARIEPPYPYNQLIYLHASTWRQPAADITANAIKHGQYETVDGQPHGAYTNALLAGLQGHADGNRDGRVSLRELDAFARQRMATRFRQIPGMRSNPARADLADQPLAQIRDGEHAGVSDQDGAGAAQAQPAAPVAPLRLQVTGIDASLQQRLAALADVVLAASEPDLTVIREDGRFKLYQPNGYLLAALETTDGEALVQRVTRKARVRQLEQFARADDFNLFVNLQNNRPVLLEGEPVGFDIVSQRPARLLLLDVDPAGLINVLYPYTPAELAQLTADQMPVTLALHDMMQVVAPVGAEHVLGVAFAGPPPQLRPFMGQSFYPESTLFQALMDLLTRYPAPMATARVQVVTGRRGDVVWE